MFFAVGTLWWGYEKRLMFHNHLGIRQRGWKEVSMTDDMGVILRTKVRTDVPPQIIPRNTNLLEYTEIMKL